MVRSPEDILADLVAVAELQLQAATSLNSEALSDATAARQDLLFELQLLSGDERQRAAASPEVRDLIAQLDELDGRSAAVLDLGLDVLYGLRSDRDVSATYRPDGRYKGTTP